MMTEADLPVAEGDKVEISSEDGVYVVESIVVSVQMQPAGSDSLFDKEKFSKEEVVQMVESGEMEVLNDDEITSEATRELVELIDIDQLEDELEGRNGLRTSKPDADGLTQYVWRMCRFHSGADTCMPVMAAGWLQDYLDQQGIDASVSGVMDDEGKEITTELEKVTDALISRFGGNPAAGAKRWEKTGIFG